MKIADVINEAPPGVSQTLAVKQKSSNWFKDQKIQLLLNKIEKNGMTTLKNYKNLAKI